MLASRRWRTRLPLWTSASPSLPQNTRCLGLLIRRHLGHEHERNCSQVCAKVAGETAQMPHLPATARLMGTGLWPFGERTPLPHQRPSPPDPPEGGPWRAPSLEGRGPLTLLPPWRAAPSGRQTPGPSSAGAAAVLASLAMLSRVSPAPPARYAAGAWGREGPPRPCGPQWGLEEPRGNRWFPRPCRRRSAAPVPGLQVSPGDAGWAAPFILAPPSRLPAALALAANS